MTITFAEIMLYLCITTARANYHNCMPRYEGNDKDFQYRQTICKESYPIALNKCIELSEQKGWLE